MRAEHLWNQIPGWVKQAESVNVFQNPYDRLIVKEGSQSAVDTNRNREQQNHEGRGQRDALP